MSKSIYQTINQFLPVTSQVDFVTTQLVKSSDPKSRFYTPLRDRSVKFYPLVLLQKSFDKKTYGVLLNMALEDVDMTKGFLSPFLRDSFVLAHPVWLQQTARHYSYKFHGFNTVDAALVMAKFLDDMQDRSSASFSLITNSRKYKTQSFSSLQEVLVGIRLVIKTLQTLGHERKAIPEFSFEVLPLLRLFVDCVGLVENGFSWSGLLSILISAFSAVCPSFKYGAQGMDTVLLSIATMALPSSLFEIIKRINVLSSSKILDEKSMFADVFVIICEYFDKLCSYMPDKVQNILKCVMSTVNFGSHYKTVAKADKLFKAWFRDKNLMLSDIFRQDVAIVSEEIKQSKAVDWIRKSPSASAIVADFTSLQRALAAYDSTARVEPLCFIFEGPAGTLKSTIMGNLIQSLRRSAYSHTVKTVGDGKDFHDTYNFEDIYYMDDVGQQGVSQFRSLINLVSCVKYPLDCAQANLKGTKYFCSPLIMFTTNQFSTLTQFSKNDGIACPEALWRRGFVFDFSQAIRKRSLLTGRVQFKWFDVESATWKYTLPSECENLDVKPYFDCTNNRCHLLKWMKSIVTTMEANRKVLHLATSLTPEEMAYLDGEPDQFYEAQSYDSINVTLGDWYFWLKTTCAEMFEQCLGTATTLSTFCFASLFGIVVSVLGSVVWTRCRNKEKFVTQSLVEQLQKTLSIAPIFDKSSTIVVSLQKQLRIVEIRNDDVSCLTVGLLSGHNILVPFHNNLPGQLVCTVFRDYTTDARELDKIPVRIVFEDSQADVRILQFNQSIATPYKNLGKLVAHVSKADSLVTPLGVVSLDTILCNPEHVHYEHSNIDVRVPYSNKLNPEQSLIYKFSVNGACGSLLCDSNSGFVGMHVAGNATNGVSVVWSAEIRNKIRDVFVQDKNYIIPQNIHTKISHGLSVIRLEENKMSSHVPTKTKLIPSQAHAIFPVERFPVNLRSNGPCTVKDIAKKSMQSVGFVESHERDFAKNYVHSIIENFSSLPMAEVIGGNNLLAGMNKDSSNGYGCLPDKTDYINFTDNILTELGQREFDRVRSSILKGDVDVKDIVWTETLKDELRDAHKVDTPRSFRCSTVIMQLITKQVFGKMVAALIPRRHTHGIAVGINPLKEFATIRNRLQRCVNTWGVDFKRWDGGMLTQVQHDIAEVIVSKCVELEQKVLAQFILYNMPHSLVLVLDDLYQTTHSMPSGSFLTAILNSIVNKYLTACWFAHECRTKLRTRPTLLSFNNTIVDYAYGDDKLTGSTRSEFNALGMSAYFASLGLDVTDDVKGVIDKATYSLNTLSFLKRQFRYHPVTKTIVCPLSKKTLYSSMSWYMSNKDATVVLQGKLLAFQREAYLHEDYSSMMMHLTEGMAQRNITCPFLSDIELRDMVIRSDADYLEVQGSFSDKY